MNCPNCGAAMELIDHRRSLHCAHCGTTKFLASPEAVDGVRVLGRSDDARRCPLCAVKMASALLDDRHAVMFCQACRGVLMPRERFAHVVHERRAWASGPPEPPSPIDVREFERRLFCPNCSTRMATHPYFGPGSVVIDTCEPCDLVWLDLGELKQISDAPGADRGRRGLARRS
jgi:Zn-finger nucleic acid-binding protein